ncbi:MAG: ATP-binding protein [Alphaproteobacteria bacterium]|nr:ATP-binding protein [Alphaproteobacteria bacterium]
MTHVLHPGADPSCRTCRGLGLQVVRDGAWARAVPCTCVPAVCPACRGMGYRSTGTGFRAPVTRCDCQVIADRARTFDAIGIPGRYAHATLGRFDPKSGAGSAHQAATRFVTQYRPGEMNRGLVFHGRVGTGKTHLAVAIVRRLALLRGVSCRFVEFSHLLQDLKYSFDRNAGTEELLAPLVSCEVLVVDELGKGRNTEFEGTVLDELVSRRYNALSTVIGTTNFVPAHAQKAPASRYTGVVADSYANLAAATPTLPSLDARLGDRVYSRLREMCDFVPVEGEDHRELSRPRA